MLQRIVYEVIDYDNREHVEYIFAATPGEAEAKAEMYFGMSNAIADNYIPSSVMDQILGRC